ncbi:hypothetical protein MMC21_000757 [Puttea exsequens]|nr:hypothetical protein [Puttea exsequens]
MRPSIASALAALGLIATPAAAHSWVERMMVINANTTSQTNLAHNLFTGDPGYARNNTNRTAPGFSDLLMVHILPGTGQPTIEERDLTERGVDNSYDTAGILPTDPMCKKTQQTQFQNDGSPRLKAAPGDLVALLYQENGHVTLPQNQPGKPPNRGSVYIYGTTQPNINPPEKFLDVYKQWNGAATGGDKRGRLLQTQNFDDGQCYQVNAGTISTSRQKSFPHSADSIMGTNLWCQNVIQIPKDAPAGKPYTLYWVWDWPTAPGADPNLPKGKAEIYTTCMDVDITSSKTARDLEDTITSSEETAVLEERQAPPVSAMNLNNMAIPSLVAMAQSGPSAAQGTPAASPPAAPAAKLTPPATPAAPPTAPKAPVVQQKEAQPAAPANPAAPAGASSPDAELAAAIAAEVDKVMSQQYPSLLALKAPVAPVTITVTPPPVYVTESLAAAPTKIAAPVAAAPASQVTDPAPAQQSAQAPSQAPPAPPSMPPTSMVLRPPVINNAPANLPPAASPMPASSPAAAPVAAAPSKIGTFTGTAMPATATNAVTPDSINAKRSCSANAACKKMLKRSRILPRK